MNKKLIFLAISSCFLLSACGTENTDSQPQESSVMEAQNSSSYGTSDSSTTQSSSEEDKTIVDLNQKGEIKYNGETMYILSVREIKDVTEEARNKTINDSNYLDYYSNSQASQAVQISILMENLSERNLGLPFLDDSIVKDQEGISMVGGWKNEGGSQTEFGYYQLDASGQPVSSLYEITPGESKIATSTVLLSSTSDIIEFTFNSTLFNDSVSFKIPITH